MASVLKKEVVSGYTKIKKLRPMTPGTRHRTVVTLAGVENNPRRSLVQGMKARNGGHKRKLREINWKRSEQDGVPGVIKRIEYNPGTSAYLALVSYRNGAWDYILASQKMKVGDILQSGPSAPIADGNCLPLEFIPVGTSVFGIEMRPGKGAQLVRSAGGFAQLVGKDKGYAIIRLRSGEMRYILLKCRAVIGAVSNPEHSLRKLGKAGASRWRGIRPHTRGVAMNPVDHPHGGGEGKTSGGRHPVSRTGVPAKGKKTRRNKRTSKFIIRRRHKK
jgi:large subunit ribosomal protein L2